MADYHHIVEQIRMALHAGDPGHNGRLAGLASAYADACTEAAQRLGRCHRLLQQGLRSEAIQLAESEPKLLDMLAVLDFPERPEWDDLAQMRDLPPAPRIPLEPARLLNEAYAEEDPLQDLLRRHRRLALQRAPLRLRIGVLRQLAAQDPGSPIWTEDVRSFEQVRLLQIQDEATEALQRHDPEWIGRLVSEVEPPGWTEPPPRTLILSLQKASAQLRAELARGTLEDVAARLDEALNARDPIRGRLARQEWSRLATAALLEPDDPIADRARPALDWLEDQDRRDRASREHEEALAALGWALDYPGTIAPTDLERLARAVHSRGDGLPDGLRQRYITRLRAAEAAETRRRRLTVAVSAAGAVLLGTLIYLAVHSQARTREADQAATSINDMLELGELDHAVALVKKLEAADSDLMRYPSLVQARERVEVAQGKESDRAVRFDQAMREAEAAPLSAKPPPALEAARALARLDTEKAALQDLVRRRAAGIQAEEGRREKALAPRLDEIARAVDQIEQRLRPGGPDRSEDPAVLGSIADSQRALSDLASEVAMAGAGLQERARALNDRLDAVRARMERGSQQARLEGAITKAVAYSPDGRGFTGAADLASALQAFAKAFPDSPRSQAFNITLRDQPVWDAIAEWDRMTAGWEKGGAAVAPPEASVRAEKCRQFQTQHPASPDFDRATSCRRVMEAMSHRSADGEGALGKLQKLMTDLLVDNLWTVTVRAPAADGPRHYYATEEPPRNVKSLRYLVGFDGKERTLRVVGDWVERIEVSPQTKIAQRFKPLLFQDPTQIDWEVVILDLIEQVRAQPGMDPVLRVALLRKALELGLEGSDPLQGALGGLKNQVDQADVDVNVSWMDPESREADQVRPKATAFLRSLPDLTALRKDVLARRAAIRHLMASRPQSVGWLTRESDAWQVRAGAVLPPHGSLRIAATGGDGHGVWKKIGAIDQGRAHLTAPDDPTLAEGRPVFVESEVVRSQ
jgi:hypothetical protein